MSEDKEQDYSPHTSPEECAESETVIFDDDGSVVQGGKIASQPNATFVATNLSASGSSATVTAMNPSEKTCAF